MAEIKSFEDILAWQEAEKLCIQIYQEFKDNRDFGFKSQIERAAVSIMNNIAEGYERNGNKEFKNFLFIAKGSAAEVRSMLSLAEKLHYIEKEKAMKLHQQSTRIAKMLSGLIKAIQ